MHYQDFEAAETVIAVPAEHLRPTGDPRDPPAESQATVEGDAAGVRPLLDLSTQLGIFSDGVTEQFGWQFTLWPACAEATLVWVPQRSGNVSRYRPRLLDSDLRPVDDPPKVAPNPSWLNPENDAFEGQSAGMLRHLEKLELAEASNRAQSWKIANGRAAARSRRYFVENQLRYMWVLTFATEHQVRGQV